MRLALAFLFAASVAQAAAYYVTIAGLGGEPDYETRFLQQATEIEKLLKSGGDVKVTTLFGSASTKARLSEALKQIATEAKKDDSLVVMMIGHGSFDGTDYKFNVVGPDVSGAELASMLDRMPQERQLVANMTSASGASLAALQRPNRILICATKSGMEKNATVFPRYWVEALRDPAADADKNESVSALEAYRYASKRTTAYYETQGRLATEHPMFDDTGNGAGEKAPSAENGQGLVGARFTLVQLGAMQKASLDPLKQALLKRKEEIEGAIDKLKYEKAAMPAGEYQTRMRALILQLVETQAEIDK